MTDPRLAALAIDPFGLIVHSPYPTKGDADDVAALLASEVQDVVDTGALTLLPPLATMDANMKAIYGEHVIVVPRVRADYTAS